MRADPCHCGWRRVISTRTPGAAAASAARSNVLLDASLSTAKICDLGKSGCLQASIVTAAGTPNRYSSPEQLAGSACGPPSDLYSLGIVMLEVLAGRAARGRDARSELQLRCAPAARRRTVAAGCTWVKARRRLHT